ncbi:alpha-L-fucosidase [Sporanaerobium hydrogeniformans]|uniref:Alpha-L-fucosidase n=1 Tax=Sporanaerobium hydrogeniformans TaxID=3072179 RepID=A0AC61DG68_9FIRM|nr:glycoside hydrolase N-terminal domain-containing protein [Sporanaerobium hydrogeniformans]PHV72259.1 alpha-L-fucosidase [Sporanaerobium hydrogeniformans]
MKKADPYKYSLIGKMPATWYKDSWKDAFPAGNGEIGISVYGGVKEETVLINHCELWHWGKRSALPDVSGSLKQTRELIDQGKYLEANAISSAALHNQGYVAELYKPCPVGDFKIRMHQEGIFKNYRRELNMETGEIVVSWIGDKINYERRAFVSRADEVIIYQIKASKPILGADLWLQMHETGYDDYTKKLEQIKDSLECEVKDQVLYYAATNEDGKDYGIVGNILSCDGEVVVMQDKLVITKAREITIALKVFACTKRERAYCEAVEHLKQLDKVYNVLLSKHAKLHKALFHSASLTLCENKPMQRSNEELLLEAYSEGSSLLLIEKLWHYGRYLFISGTRKDTQPFNLYGLWGGRYELLWSHHMANINIQMMYWQALVGGYSETMKALITYYINLMEDFRENAKKIFGLPGIYMSAGSTPGYGLANQVVPVITNWISGAGWIAAHFYEYYRYTLDKEALHKYILPFMLEALAFYEAFMVLDEKGDYTIYPSVSPENTPGNLNKKSFKHMSHANPTAKNATMDFAIIKEFLNHFIDLCENLPDYQERVIRCKEMLKHFPDYQVNEEGAIKEWMTKELEDFYYHRHLSHCYPIFPGREMVNERDTLLGKAFEKAVDLRILGGQSGWSLAFMACINARLGRGNEALLCLNHLTRSCLTNSLFTLHNDWRKMGMTLDMSREFEDIAPVQLDANLGIVAAIQEMLLYADQKILKVLPALPNEWEQGTFKDFHFCDGVIAVEWNQKKPWLNGVVKANRRTKILIYFPSFLEGKEIKMSLNKSQTISLSNGIEFELEKGEAVTFCIE